MFSCTHAQMHETSLAQPQAVLYLAQHMFHGYSMDYILKTEFFFLIIICYWMVPLLFVERYRIKILPMGSYPRIMDSSNNTYEL